MRTACIVLAIIQAVSADAAVGPAAPDPPWMAKLPKGVRDMLKDPTLNKSSIQWTDFVPAGKLNATALPTDPSALLELVDSSIPDPPSLAKLPKGVRDMLKDPTLNKSSIPWTDFVPAGKLNATEPAPPMLAAERVPPTGILGLAHLALAFSAGMALTVAILAVARYLPNAVRTSRSIIRLRLGRADEESLTSSNLSVNERDAGVRTGAYAII